MLNQKSAKSGMNISSIGQKSQNSMNFSKIGKSGLSWSFVSVLK